MPYNRKMEWCTPPKHPKRSLAKCLRKSFFFFALRGSLSTDAHALILRGFFFRQPSMFLGKRCHRLRQFLNGMNSFDSCQLLIHFEKCTRRRYDKNGPLSARCLLRVNHIFIDTGKDTYPQRRLHSDSDTQPNTQIWITACLCKFLPCTGLYTAAATQNRSVFLRNILNSRIFPGCQWQVLKLGLRHHLRQRQTRISASTWKAGTGPPRISALRSPFSR